MVLPKKDCQLNFASLLVYSYLTYVTRHNRRVSQKAIGKALGLHRVTTVRDALTKLKAFGLAEAEGHKYLARDGQPTWFHRRKDATEHWHWVDRYAYFRLFLPGTVCPLSPRQNAVLWLLRSWQKKGKVVTRQGMASQLRISRRTVISSVNTLTELGLWNGSKVVVNGCLHYWQDAKTKQADGSDERPLRLARYIMRDFPASYVMRLYPERNDMQNALGRHERRMIDAGFKATDIQEVWDYARETLDRKCPRLECYTFHFWKLFEVVEKETRANRRRGLFHGPNSKGLLKARTNAFGKVVEAQLRRNGMDSLLGWEPNFEKTDD